MKTLLFLSAALPAFYAGAQTYDPFEMDGKFGFALNCRPVIPAQYQYVTHFREGLALVRMNDLWGYIDSTGAWVVEPRFSNAQPFVDGKAYVSLKGKTGLIDPEGNYLLEPLYDNFTETYYGMEIRVGDKKGLISDKWEKTIPVEYLSLNVSNDFVSAKRAENDYDLYYAGERILEHMQKEVTYAEIQSSYDHAIVRIADKEGVINSGGSWVVRPEYRKVEYLYIGGYYGSEQPMQELYKLDNTEYQYFDDGMEMGELVGPVQIYLTDIGGKMLQEAPFEEAMLVEDPYNYNRSLQLRTGGKIAKLNPDYTIEITPYVSVVDHYTWKFCDDGTMTHIFNEMGKEMAVVEEVEIPQTEYEIYDEYGEPTGIYTEGEFKPYVIIYKNLGNEERLRAFFDLNEAKYVSPWTSFSQSVDVYTLNGMNRFYATSMVEEQYRSIYYSGMEPTGFDYSSVMLLNEQYVVVQKKGQEDFTLLFLEQNGGTRELTHIQMADMSTNLYLTEMDPEGMSDPYLTYLFSRSFVYFNDALGHYGVITDNQQVIPARYDAIAQNASLEYIVDVSLNGKWGSVDLRNGNVIEPAYDQPLVFYYEEYMDLTYCLFEEQGYYINSAGQKFYSLSPEYVPFKEKGKCGMKVYRDFNYDDNNNDGLVVAIPAIYKEIKQPDEYANRLIAKNAEGKYGMIDGLNNVVLPFEYTNVDYSWEELAFEKPVFKTAKGKKKGLFDPFTGNTIPAEYDGYAQARDTYGAQQGILVRSGGKVGLYNNSLKLVLPCVYDAIELVNDENETTQLRAQRNGKWYILRYFYLDAVSEKKLLEQQPYDYLLNLDGYVKTADGYDRYELPFGIVSEKGLTEMMMPITESNYHLFLEEGFIGAKDENNKVVLKPSLTNILWWEGDTLVSVKNGELTYYSLSLKKQFTANEW